MFTPGWPIGTFLIPRQTRAGRSALVESTRRASDNDKVVSCSPPRLGVAARWTVARAADRCEVLGAQNTS